MSDPFEEMFAGLGLFDTEVDGYNPPLSHKERTVEQVLADEQLLADADYAIEEFERRGRWERLDYAISQYRTLVDRIPGNDPKLSATMYNLGIALLRRFEHLGNLGDLDEAIEQLELTTRLTPDGDKEKPSRLSNLGTALSRRFSRLGDREDSYSAIHRQRAAVDLVPADDPNKLSYLHNLGSSLQSHFEDFGVGDDVKEAVTLLQQTVDLARDDHPDKPMFLASLADSLRSRFHLTGNIADIDAAVAKMRLVVDLTDYGHTGKPGYLSTLGSCLEERFERLGSLADIDNAIIYQQQAVNLTSDSHPNKARRLTDLGHSFYTRFRRFGNGDDIDKAISLYQKALILEPTDNHSKPLWLNHLATALITRFEFSGNSDDLDNAIAQAETASDLTPLGHLRKSYCLDTLARALMLRSKQLGTVADLSAAIRHMVDAIDVLRRGHPSRSARLNNLGGAIWDRFTRLGHTFDAELAIEDFSSAATTPEAPPTDRFTAVDSWIQASSMINHPSLLDAYECALDLLPLVAWLGLPIADRHQHLIKIGGITRDAAAAAISAEQYDVALEWLEQGRSIVWTQILHLRTPVDRLREVNPELADRLLQVSQSLDQGGQATDTLETNISLAEEKGRQYRELTGEWESIIKQVRSLPGFEDFLRPLRSFQLKKAARYGPVVVLNIAQTRCDALALVPGSQNVVHIPLPNITSQRVSELQYQLNDQLCVSGIRMRDTRAAKRVTDEPDKETCRRVLTELWANLVEPVLSSLKLSPHPCVLPRIWWCATGPLAFLPIHAAGIYGQGSGDSQLSNYAISSYTPTLSTLLEPVKPIANSSFSLLSVIQASAPGGSALPSTKKELQCIRKHVPSHGHIVLDGPAGTKKRVMENMKGCNWLHLACHGIQETEEPTKSGLLLHDGLLTLEQIIKLDLPKAEFAFLSACQTTTGDESLSEEAVHIAGGMLLAGYSSVMATMWSIKDNLAPMVTDEFYGYIMKEGGRPDPRKTAEALHMSMQKLRKQPGVQFLDWIPFVHLGV
ncbi:hypothetical protein CPB86DRAFT_791449 [Serendipita vermifera]|nr:hypothetical protein CPB86DRAFT_791449 [Serendipita vermifera]